MFEEAGGVGAEEVVSSNEYDLCFVDTAEVSSCSRHCQQIQGVPKKKWALLLLLQVVNPTLFWDTL